jgi:hypothetical protein
MKFFAVERLTFWPKGQKVSLSSFKCCCIYYLNPSSQLAGISITGKTSNVITAAQSIIYDASNFILLEPGFSTESGAVFETKLIGCN